MPVVPPESPEKMSSLAAVALAGWMFGIKHALDADHLAAVATLASEKCSGWRAAWVGTLWGLGHTAALAFAGAAIIGLGVAFPPWLTWWLELTVASTLLWLGGGTLWTVLRGHMVHVHLHRHGSRWHVHPHAHAGATHDPRASNHHGPQRMRPLAFGWLHGLAGSAALFLVILSSQPSPAWAWCYLACFALGSTTAMTAFSCLVAVPLRRTQPNWQLCIQASAGVASIAVGLALGCELLFA